MDRYTALLAMILLAGLPVLARIWLLAGRDDDRLFGPSRPEQRAEALETKPTRPKVLPTESSIL